MFAGSGTLINFITIILGSLLGVLIAHRLTVHLRSVVTDGLGLITLTVGGLSVADIVNPALTTQVPNGTSILILLGSVLIGGLLGASLGIERWLESLGERAKARFAKDAQSNNFTEGFVAASLLFSIGPLAIMGSISDGLGNGNEQLLLKSTLDFFAAIAFAATFGMGVSLSAFVVLAVQGSFTIFGKFLGEFISEPAVLAMNAAGGLLLLGIGLNLLNIRKVPVGDLLPAIAIAPIITTVLLNFA
jgi:uncharacterized membrane protein YqgA involved in biofilm formation